MRDYRLGNDKKKDSYILGYTNDGESICSYVSNGKFERPTKFDQIESNEENIEKLNKKMNDQLNYGIKNKAKYKLKRDISRVITTAGAVVGTASIFTHNKVVFFAGVVSLGVVVYAGINARSRNKDVKEIEKAEIISKNMDDLKHLEKYPNALALSDDDFAAEAEEYDLLITKVDGKDVPNANRIEEYSLEDLEYFVKNIDREKNIGFVKTK
ncbi:MAG: hypothetical protein IJH34_03490 [Romboutsia sp.]|nr:hypothetical protein [Romboutsia sp.]